jgi:hypothetical protein
MQKLAVTRKLKSANERVVMLKYAGIPQREGKNGAGADLVWGIVLQDPRQQLACFHNIRRK